MKSHRVEDFHIEDWLPAGLGLDDVIALLAGIAMVAIVFAAWHAMRPKNAFERRFADIVDRRETLRREALLGHRHRERSTPVGLMHEAVKYLNLLRSKHATDARQTLARAGLRSKDAMVGYLFARTSLPLVFGLAVLIDAYVLHALPLPEGLFPVVALGAVGIGFYAPSLYLKNLTEKRGKRLQLALPDGLDLMVICAEAGLSLDATLMRVSRELESTWPELAEELGLTAAELTFMPERRVALENLSNRTDLPALRGVVNTLQQTAKFGTPLAASLRVLSAEFREKRMIAAEEKAARLPALLTVPMIVFILPTLFIVLLGPAALNVIDTFSSR
jgi:tight adherence protein C